MSPPLPWAPPSLAPLTPPVRWPCIELPTLLLNTLEASDNHSLYWGVSAFTTLWRL